MDGDWLDSSGNASHGFSYNGVGFSTDSKFGPKSGKFDGVDDYAEIGGSTGLSGSYITVEGWVKIAASPSSNQMIFDNESASPWYGYLLYLCPGGKLCLDVNSKGVSTTLSGSTAVSPNAWHHVAGTYDGSSMTVFVDGVQDGVVQKTGPVDYTIATRPTIGKRSTGAGGYFSGVIDELAVYKRALSPEEIAVHYSSGVINPNAPAVPTVNTVPAAVSASTIAISGTKPANTSIWINSKKIVAADASTDWQGTFGVLQPGLNILNVTAVDISYAQSQPVPVNVTYDNIPPAAPIIDRPAPYTKESTVTMSGTKEANTYLYINNQVTSAQFASTSWSVPVNLPIEGKNDFTLYAQDNATNKSSAVAVSVVRDSIAPNLVVSTLADGSFTNNNTLNISGTVTDANLKSLKVNGNIVVVAEDGSFSTAISLPQNGNTIIVVAEDAAGNASSDTRTITFDNTIPNIIIKSPADNSYTKTSPITVTGSLDKDAAVTVGGKSADMDGRNFSAVVDLSQGLNTFDIVATDPAQNTSSQKRTVTLDSINPDVAINAPRQDITTRQSLIEVSGTVGDADPVTVSSTFNGVTTAITPTDGAFRFNLDFSNLGDGTYPVIVTVTDAADNVTSVTRNIIYKTKAPNLSIEGVKSPTNVSSQTIHGIMSEGATVTVVCNTGATVGEVSYPDTTSWQVEVTDLVATEDNVLTVTATDLAGNTANLTSAIVLDVVKPTAALTINAGAPSTNSTQVQLGISALDAHGLGQMSLFDGTGWSEPESFTPSKSWTLSGEDGSKEIKVRVSDLAGNWSDDASASIILDTIAPVTTPSQAGGAFNAPQTVSLTASESAVIRYTLDGSTPTLASAVYSVPLTISTSSTLSFFAVDRAGNVEVPPHSVSFEMDTTPPSNCSISINGGSNATRSLEVNLGLHAEDTHGVEQMQFSNDGQNWSPAEPYSTSRSWTLSSGDGDKKVYVKFKDQPGNWSSDPVTASISLDTTAPRVDAAPAAGFYKSAQAVALTSNEQATIFYTTDGSVPGEGSTVYSGPIVVEHALSLKYYGKDAAGNSGEVKIAEYVIDSEPPKLTLFTLPDKAITNNETLNITGTVSDDHQLKGLVINGTAVPVNPADGSFSYALLLDSDANSVSVTATDAAGNQTVDTRTITLDETAPELTIDAPTDNLKTNIAQLTVTGHLNETSTVIVKLGEIVQPVTFSGNDFTSDISLAPGYNQIEITAVDEASNTSTAKRTVVFDDKAPSLEVTDPAEDVYTNEATFSIKGRGTDALTKISAVTISLDGKKFSPAIVDGAFEQVVTLTEQKQYPVVVTATNEAGTSTSVQRNIIFDTTPPELTIDEPDPTNHGSVVLTGTQEEGTSVSITSSSATVGEINHPTATTWSVTVSGLASGENAVDVKSTDLAGNTTEIKPEIVYDVTPPTGSLLINGGAPATNTTAVDLKMAATDASGVTQMRFSNNGSDWSAPEDIATYKKWDLPPGEGPKQVYVQFKDKAGNWSVDPITAEVTLDVTPPEVVLPPVSGNGYVNTPVVTVSGTVNEAVSSVTVNGKQAAVNGLSFSLVGVHLDEGVNGLFVSATDIAGNTGNATMSVVLDTLTPEVTVDAPADRLVTGEPELSLSGTVTEDNVDVTVNGSAATVSGRNWNAVYTLKESANTITVEAADRAGNRGRQSITVTLDSVPPQVTITSPNSGTLTNNPNVTITGTVSSANATVAINGTPVPLNNSTFTAATTLKEGENSFQVVATGRTGKTGSSSLNVTLDTKPPQDLNITAPAQAAAGDSVQVGVSASDSHGLSLLEVRANGAPIWATVPTDAAPVSSSFSFMIPPGLSSGASVALEARVVDAAGNAASKTALISVVQGATGAGSAEGIVIDDARGLPLAESSVKVTDATGAEQTITTDEDGRWSVELPSGVAVLQITKDGHTGVERQVSIASDLSSVALDGRLTPLADAVVIGAAGGMAKSSLGAAAAGGSSPLLTLAIPAGALPGDSEIRLTPVSNQGLIAPLPAGWSPIAALDVRVGVPGAQAPLGNANFVIPATITAPTPTEIAQGNLQPLLAYYDGSSHRWISQGRALISDDGHSVSATLQSAGQYALLVADPAPGSPPAAEQGAALAAASVAPVDFDSLSTTARVVPQAALPSVGLRAAGEVVVTARDGFQPLPRLGSGQILSGKITQKFDLTNGETNEPNVYSEDIVLYRTPCVTNIAMGSAAPVQEPDNLRTTFPVSPFKDFTLMDLLTGKVRIDLFPRQGVNDGGVLIGSDGARLADSDGTVLAVPSGALNNSTPVSTKTIPASTAATLVGADFTLLKAVELSVGRGSLASSATLSIAAPTGFNSALPVVVAKAIEVRGGKKLKLVAAGRVTGSLINSVPAIAAGLSAPGITESGSYYFLQAKGPIGFVKGTVTDSAAKILPGMLVTTNTGTLADLSSASGGYLTAAPVGPVTATALEQNINSKGNSPGTLSAGTAATVDIVISMLPVVTISPADGDQNVQPGSQIVVSFSKPVNRGSVTSDTVSVAESNGVKVSGVFSFNVDGTSVTFYPAQQLKPESSYTVSVSTALRDMQGYAPAAQASSTFKVIKTVPPPMPAAGAVVASFPDAEGCINVTASQGSADAGDTVYLINDATGEISAFTADSDGSFKGRVHAQLGNEIKAVLMDRSGNQTVISYVTYKGDDGKYLVTRKGGKVPGDGGTLLDIPTTALVGPTVVKVAPLEKPANVPDAMQFHAAFSLDNGGMKFQQPVQISVPVPPSLAPGAVPFLVQATQLPKADGTVETVYAIIDSAKVVDGRLTTACPPFDGVLMPGTMFQFLTAPSAQPMGPVTVSGTTYQELNGTPGYQPAPAGVVNEPQTDPRTGEVTYLYDRPISGAVIRSPQSENVVSFSNASGHYATYGFSVQDVCRNFPLTATHPLTMKQVSVNITTCDAPYIVNNFDFRLADKDTVLPDSTPPSIDLNVTLAPDQGPDAKLTSGSVTVGSELQVQLDFTDQMIKKGTLSVEFRPEDNSALISYPVPLVLDGATPSVPPIGNSPALFNWNTQLFFPDGIQGSLPNLFRPVQAGLYTLVAEVEDLAGNRNKQALALRAVSPGNVPTSYEGPPAVISLNPGGGVKDVRVDTNVTALFSEQVTNVTTATFQLIDTETGKQVPAAVMTLLDSGLMKAVLTPKTGLQFGHTYEIRISQAITDVASNISAGGALMHLDSPVSSKFTTIVPNAHDLPEDEQFTSGRGVALYNDDDNQRVFSYVTAGDQGYRVADVTDSANPALVFPDAEYKFPAGFNYRGVAVEQQQKLMGMTENITFASGSQYGYVRFYDLSTNPANPVVVGREKLAQAYSGIPGRIAMQGSYAYIATINAGIQVVNTDIAIQRANLPSDGSSIVGVFNSVGEVDSTGRSLGQPNDLILYGGTKAILTTIPGNLVSLDISTPARPAKVSVFHPDGFSFTQVAVAEDYVYGDSSTANEAIDLVLSGTREGKIVTVDITDPVHPQMLGVTVDEQGNPVSSVVSDITINKFSGLAYVTTFNSVQVIDLKDPKKPHLLTTITQLPEANAKPGTVPEPVPIGDSPAVAQEGGWIFLANQAKGLRALNMGVSSGISYPCDDCYNYRR